MNTIDSTKLIELAEADYKMLKEKGKEGEEVLHYNGFLDGFARGLHEGSNPWHKISEENKLPKEDTFMVSYPAKFNPEFCYYEKHLDKWVVNNLAFTFEAFKKMYSHWMPIPEIKED